MTINFSSPRATELKPRIVVFGVGGAGGNAVNNMIEAGLEGVEFVVANTDAQQLSRSHTERRIQLGASITEGLGAGAQPKVGQSAAEESIPEITEHLDGAHMVFITAGMGGGTGTGAAPIIAQVARERRILTVGVVTKPFHFEGRHRMRLADEGVAELQRHVDTLIVIPNQNLFRVANERTTFAEAFGMADEVLHSGVRSITDLMVHPGLINLDFADVRAVMTEMGKAMMGTGEASGEERALMAAQNAIQNPLLDEVSLKGAKAVLINVTGGLDMTLLEVDEAANAISSEVDAEANIIFGAAFDPALDGKIRVSVVATGMDNAARAAIETPSRKASASVAMPATLASPPVDAVEPAFEAAPSLPLAPQPVVRPPSAPAEPAIISPGRVAALAPAPEPVAAPPLRIVDPAVEQESDELYPPLAQRTPRLHPRAEYRSNPATAVEHRRPPPKNPLPDPRTPPEKKGWLTLFGGGRAREELSQPQHRMEAPQRYQDPAPSELPRGVDAEPVVDDLDIPSFLRRLAN